MAIPATKFSGAINSMMKTLSLLLVLAAAAPGIGHLHFALDLFSHFKAHYLLVFLLLGVFFVVTKSYPWAVLALAGAANNLSHVAPWYVRNTNSEISGGHDSIKVLLSNVHMRNSDATRLVQVISREQPDIVGLVEVDQKWIDRLSSLHKQYPYHIESPSDAYRGLALYSRLPITQSVIVNFGISSAPTVVADVVVGDSSVQVLLTHPAAPMTSELARQRNEQLQKVGEYVAEAEEPVVLIGDLNITMWDRTYKAMIRDSGLVNSRAGFGLGTTWPAIPLLGIPIDHILVTAPLQAGEFRVHESIGSDHFPISARVLLGHRQRPESKIAISRYLDEMRDDNNDELTVVRPD